MSDLPGITVHLIRHGESMANAGHATSDPATIPLTSAGWEQARRAADLFERPPSLIVTSAYLRTQQTAAPTRERFPQAPHAIWAVQEFTYLSPDHCVNMTPAQRRPLVEAYWERCDPSAIDGPGAESFASLVGRAGQMLRDVQALGSGEVAVFTHGQFMQMVTWLVRHPGGDWSARDMRAWRERVLAEPLSNTQIIRLGYAPRAGWTSAPCASGGAGPTCGWRPD